MQLPGGDFEEKGEGRTEGGTRGRREQEEGAGGRARGRRRSGAGRKEERTGAGQKRQQQGAGSSRAPQRHPTTQALLIMAPGAGTVSPGYLAAELPARANVDTPSVDLRGNTIRLRATGVREKDFPRERAPERILGLPPCPPPPGPHPLPLPHPLALSPPLVPPLPPVSPLPLKR